jgi:hypothetical protein
VKVKCIEKTIIRSQDKCILVFADEASNISLTMLLEGPVANMYTENAEYILGLPERA